MSDVTIVQADRAEVIAKAIQQADDAFGYSFIMTALVDGVATHTLAMEGFDPVHFEDREGGYALIAERRNRLRADAVLAALKPFTDDLVEALRSAPIIGRGETYESFSGRQDYWLNGQYRTALNKAGAL
jgi:hypothetical protein